MSLVLRELKSSLSDDTRTKNMLVELMGLVNTDPSQAVDGWVGIYIDTVAYSPRTIGTGSRNWQMAPTLRVIVQAVDRDSTEQAHAKLEKFIKDVLDVVLGNTTLAETVEALTGIQVDYAFSEEDRVTLQHIGALITIQFVGRSN
jgi:UDP-N-acetyl-D-mannosaminuronate dehydrogenase